MTDKEYFKIKSKERRKYWADQKRCVHCGKRDDRTVKGFSLCEVCRSKNAKYRDRLRTEQHEQNKGVWILDGIAGDWICSKCNHESGLDGRFNDFRFCPHCGKEMRSCYEKV